MILNKCKHEWTQFSNSSGTSPAKYECKKCKVWLSASEVYQLESLNHIKGFQKWLSIIAIIISVLSITIAYLK